MSRVLNHWLVQLIGAVAAITGIVAFVLPQPEPWMRNAAIVSIILGCGYWVGQIMVRAFRHLITINLSQSVLARRFGYEYLEQLVEAAVDEDGSVIVARTIRLRPTEPLKQVWHYIIGMTPNTGGDLPKPSLRVLSPSWVKANITVVDNLLHDQHQVYQVEFANPVSSGIEVKYVITERLKPRTVATPFSGQESPLGEEFLSWAILAPTRFLRLRVTVPSSCKATAVKHDASYLGGLKGVTNVTEAKYLEKRLCVSDGNIQSLFALDVPYPIMGLLYKIRWSYSQ